MVERDVRTAQERIHAALRYIGRDDVEQVKPLQVWQIGRKQPDIGPKPAGESDCRLSVDAEVKPDLTCLSCCDEIGVPLAGLVDDHDLLDPSRACIAG